MITWNNLDKLTSYQELAKTNKVKLAEVMSGENGAERVKNYSIPMAAGLAYNYAAKQVDEEVLAALGKLAEEAQLTEKFEALYNGEVITRVPLPEKLCDVTSIKGVNRCCRACCYCQACESRC